MCDICYGSQPNCPVCGKDAPKEVECPECRGDKEFYFDGRGNPMDYEDWMVLSPDEKIVIKCTHCDGVGVVEEKD